MIVVWWITESWNTPGRYIVNRVVWANTPTNEDVHNAREFAREHNGFTMEGPDAWDKVGEIRKIVWGA